MAAVAAAESAFCACGPTCALKSSLEQVLLPSHSEETTSSTAAELAYGALLVAEIAGLDDVEVMRKCSVLRSSIEDDRVGVAAAMFVVAVAARALKTGQRPSQTSFYFILGPAMNKLTSVSPVYGQSALSMLIDAIVTLKSTDQVALLEVLIGTSFVNLENISENTAGDTDQANENVIPVTTIVSFLGELLGQSDLDEKAFELASCVGEKALEMLTNGNPKVQQAVIDSLLPQLCKRFSDTLLSLDASRFHDYVLELECSEKARQLVVGIVAACQGNIVLEQHLVGTIVQNVKFWTALRLQLISPVLVEQRRAFFLLKATLAMYEVSDSRWSALCGLIEALSHAEVHHTKNSWTLMDFLLALDSANDSSDVHPTFRVDEDWIQLVFEKALDHSNHAVRKNVMRCFMDDWPRWTGDHKYMRFSPELLFKTILPGMNQRDLYRVVVTDDLIGTTGSLFGIEERFPSCFVNWCKDICDRDPSQYETVMCCGLDFLTTTEFKSNSPFMCALLAALLEAKTILGCEPVRWLKGSHVDNLCEAMVALQNIAECPELTRGIHAVFRMTIDLVLTYGDQDNCEITSILRLTEVTRLRVFPEKLVELGAWIASSPSTQVGSLCEQAVLFVKESVHRSTSRLDSSRVAMVIVLLCNSEEAVTRCLDILLSLTGSLYSSPYQPKSGYRRALCVLSELVGSWASNGDSKVEALLERALNNETVRDQIIPWCNQHIGHDCLARNMALLERLSGSQGLKEELAFLAENADEDSSEHQTISDSNYAVPMIRSLGHSTIRASLDKPVWQSLVEAVEDGVSNPMLCTKALMAISAYGRHWVLSNQTHEQDWNRLMSAISNLRTAEMEVDNDVSRSAFLSAMEEQRWSCLEAICKVEAFPHRLTAKSQSDLVKVCVVGMDICSEKHLPCVLEILSFATSFGFPTTLELLEFEQVWRAATSAARSAYLPVSSISFQIVKAIFQDHLFQDPEAVNRLVRPAWQELLVLGQKQHGWLLAMAKHVVSGVLTRAPARIRDWIPELLQMCEHVQELTTSETTDVRTLEVCHSIPTPYGKVKGVLVHPATFVHRSVLALVELAEPDCIGAVVNLALDSLSKRIALQANKSLHSSSGYQSHHMWQLVKVCCTRLADIGDEALIRSAFVALMEKVYSKNCNRRSRASIELCFVKLMQVKAGAPLRATFLGHCASLLTERFTLQLSGLLVLGGLVFASTELADELLWSKDDTQDFLQRASAVALPYVSVSDVSCRAVATDILASSFRELNQLGLSDGGDPTLVKYTYDVICSKDTVGVLSDLYRVWNAGERGSLNDLLAAHVNAYGETHVWTLAGEAMRFVDQVLLDVFGKVRSVVTRKAENSKDLRQHTEKQSKALLSSDNVGELNLQQKIDPWQSWSSTLAQLDQGERVVQGAMQQEMLRKKRATETKLVVVTSLLREVPSIAALARTSEIFGVGSFVVDDLEILQDDEFKGVAVSSESWLNIAQVKRDELKTYLAAKQLEGYLIVGLEQGSVQAQDLASFQMPADNKVVLVCTNEDEGFPVPLLGSCDSLARVKRYGNTRALMTHIFGAIGIWECTQQILSNT